MVVSTRWMLALCVLLCAIVCATSTTNGGPIQLSELSEELRRESEDVRLVHLSFIFLAASYGDQVYQLSKNVSAECAVTLRAISLMFEKLAISDEVNDVVIEELVAVGHEVEGGKQLVEHPLELFCAKVTKKYAQNANLSGAYAQVKGLAAQLTSAGSRPPYLSAILNATTAEVVRREMVDKMAVPEFARLMAAASFLATAKFEKENSSSIFSPRRHAFAKTCVAVAREAQFADAMQLVFAKSVNDTWTQIAVDDRQQKWQASIDDGGTWWAPQMLRTVYGYVTSDPSLKKEIERMAPIVNEYASAEDFDFSKL